PREDQLVKATVIQNRTGPASVQARTHHDDFSLAYRSSAIERSAKKKIIVMICHEVFCLPSRSAGRIQPLVLAIRRKPVIKKSRATTVVAAHAGMALRGTNEIKAAAIMILSTSGSINFPKFVITP